jgi:hypothetical membrane protein
VFNFYFNLKIKIKKRSDIVTPPAKAFICTNNYFHFMNNRGLAGAFMFAGTVQFLIGMLLAELLYPGYSISGNYISDLGATCRDTCVTIQPSAFIFNTSAMILGILILLSSYCIWHEFKNYLVTIFIGLSGSGAFCVGLFPETAGIIHVIVSFIAFLFAALSAISASILMKRPFTYFSIFLGILGLVALVLFGLQIYVGLGPGGMERMIAYPVLLWAIGFGGYLMASRA